MTKRCKCGKTKTVQPLRDSRTMEFTCRKCEAKRPRRKFVKWKLFIRQ